MDINEAMRRIRAGGFSGLSLWNVGEAYMACLLGEDKLPDYDTNLWDYTNTPEQALRAVVSKAELIAARRAAAPADQP